MKLSFNVTVAKILQIHVEMYMRMACKAHSTHQSIYLLNSFLLHCNIVSFTLVAADTRMNARFPGRRDKM